MKKKIFSILLIAVMVLSSFSAVFAAEGDVTMEFTGGKAGHTYTAYQILKGDATASTSTTAGSLENIQWGDDAANIKIGDKTLTELYATAPAAAKAINTQDDARAFAQSLNVSAATGTPVELDKDGTVTFTVKPGYYVIIDTITGTTAASGDYSSAVMVSVAGNVKGSIKGDAPTSDKKVADTNDSAKTQVNLSGIQNADWQDSADYDINDFVPFRLTATTASNVAAYKKYHVTFQDNQCDGLAMPESWIVEVLGLQFTVAADGTVTAKDNKDSTDNTKVTVTKVTPKTGNDFAIRVDFEQVDTNKTYLDAECNNTLITVKYESKLTGDNVVIGKDGNPNTSYIEYSNKPESEDGEEEGRTPDDTVIVFTFKLDVDKVDGTTGAPLAGADFTLYKEVVVTDGVPAGAQTGAEIVAAMSDDAVKKAAAYKDANNDNKGLLPEKSYIVVDRKTVSATGDSFDFKGIDDGNYVLVETTVPTGYNPWKAVNFTVTATHTNDGDTNPLELTSLSADPFQADHEGGKIEKAKKVKADPAEKIASGEIFTEIENNSGSELPETGGMGTTIIYILGAALVVGAGVVLVSRKKTNDR